MSLLLHLRGSVVKHNVLELLLNSGYDFNYDVSAHSRSSKVGWSRRESFWYPMN